VTHPAAIASILASAWEAGGPADAIIGSWAENGDTYSIRVPTAIRDALIDLQNCLHARYAEIIALRNTLEQRECEFEALAGVIPGKPVSDRP